MRPEGPIRVLIEMLLGEDEIAYVSDQYVAAKVEDDIGLEADYYLDADSEGQWQPLDHPGAVDPEIKRKLEQLLAQHPEAAAVARQLRQGRVADVGSAPTEEDAEWLAEYHGKLREWSDAGRLIGLPYQLGEVFKGRWAMLDVGPYSDFTIILPTLPGPSRRSTSRERGLYQGVYVLRTHAHRSFSQFDIKEGEYFASYIPKLLQEGPAMKREGLLTVRDNLVRTNLGRMLRRDQHIRNVTINLEQFGNYEELRSYVDSIAESA